MTTLYVQPQFTPNEWELVKEAIREKLGRSTDLDETETLKSLAGYMEESV